MKKCILISLLFAGFLNQSAKSQIYYIKAFDGSPQKILLTPDDAHRTLTITCLNNTIHLPGFTGIIGEPVVLNKSFLQIVYNARGGTGVRELRLLLLCAHNKKLVESLHVTSLFNEEFMDFNPEAGTPGGVTVKAAYELTLSLTGNDSDTYKMTGKIHGEKKSKADPKTDYNYNQAGVLNFDTARYIFYSKREHLSQYFNVYDAKSREDIKLYVMGVMPAVILGNKTYYYIKGRWYERGDDDSLTKY